MLLYVRMLLMMAVTLYTSRVILQTLGVEDFGIYNVVGGFVSIFGFLTGCLSTATQRYITFELGREDFKKLKDVFCTSIVMHSIMAVILFIFAEIIGLCFLFNKMQIPIERIDAAFWVFQCSVFSALIMLISVPYNALIIAHEKMSVFAIVSIIDVSLKLGAVYLLQLSSGDKLILYAVFIIIIQLMIRLFYGWFCNRRFKESKFVFSWNKPLIKEMLGFGSWSIFGNLAFVASTQGVNVLLNMFFGPSVNAARGIAVQVQNAINMFSSNFQTAINPQITKTYAAGNYNDMHKLICRSGKFSYFLLIILSLPVVVETDYILHLWLGIVPEYTVLFLRIMLCITIIDAISNPLMISATATGNIKLYHSVVGGILLAIIPVSYLILKMGGNPESVFIIHLCLCCTAFFARLCILRSLIHLSIRTFIHKVVLKCIFITIISVPIPVLLGYWLDASFVSLILICVVNVITVGTSIYFIGLDQEESVFIRGKLSAFALKFKSKHN